MRSRDYMSCLVVPDLGPELWLPEALSIFYCTPPPCPSVGKVCIYRWLNIYIYKTQVLWTMSFFLGSRGFIKTEVGMCSPVAQTHQPAYLPALSLWSPSLSVLILCECLKAGFFQCLTWNLNSIAKVCQAHFFNFHFWKFHVFISAAVIQNVYTK